MHNVPVTGKKKLIALASNNFWLFMLATPFSVVLVDVTVSKEIMTRKFIKLPELTKVAISRSKLYTSVKEGTFPAPINLGARAIAWIDEEVDEWVARRVEASRNNASRAKQKAVAQ